MPTNHEFLQALFGDNAPWVHVTDFTHDPDHIPEGQELRAWRGDYYCRYQFRPISNQYFTISNFYADEKDQARRRKSLYRHTSVIVLDDVKEKLPVHQVYRLPKPSWIMETSTGSEQWGYILDTPCESRSRVENLLDGLVANGLAPDGKDPGMKGVTRYVRLPDGFNTKKKKRVDGQPFKVRITDWHPERKVSIEELAMPFNVDLDAVRREQRVDGAAQIDDHPLLALPDIIHVKEERSKGRFDITCPWIEDHTNAINNGAAFFTNTDGSIGFKCHHGSCQHRTGKHLLEFVEEQVPGFGQEFAVWKTMYAFSAAQRIAIATPVKPVESNAPVIQTALPGIAAVTTEQQILSETMGELRRHPSAAPEARELAAKILQVTDTMPAIDRQHWHEEVRLYMDWSKAEMKNIIKSLRETWYTQSKAKMNFFEEVVFVGEINQFYDAAKDIFYTPDAYQNSYQHMSADARKEALSGMVMKVDKIDYAPNQPRIFTEGHLRYANTWTNTTELPGAEGDVKPFMDHFEVIGWESHRKHVLQFMAYTIRHPDKKINHMLILGSGEGAGKDFLLTPMMRALGKNSKTIDGEELLTPYNGFCFGTKHLHINEVELADHNEARAIANKLKPMTAAPPTTLRITEKWMKGISVRNIVNCTLSTNSPVPLNFNSPTRRAYAMWTDFTTRDENEETLPEWVEYWRGMWDWMNNGGAEAVIYYLRNYVDLSDFNAGAPPPMTDFLREIRIASESPAQQTVRAFIDRGIGAFAADLVTAEEMAATLRMGPLLAAAGEACMMTDMNWFTAVKVGTIMRKMGYPKHRCHVATNGGGSWKSIFVLRKRQVYAAFTTGDLLLHYNIQSSQAKKQNTLRVVS